MSGGESRGYVLRILGYCQRKMRLSILSEGILNHGTEQEEYKVTEKRRRENDVEDSITRDNSHSQGRHSATSSWAECNYLHSPGRQAVSI